MEAGEESGLLSGHTATWSGKPDYDAASRNLDMTS